MWNWTHQAWIGGSLPWAALAMRTTCSRIGFPDRWGSGWKPSNCLGGLSMIIPVLPQDSSEFLKSLNSANVEYLLIGGYAVGIHG